MTRASLRRIYALIYRHTSLYRHSWPRVVELAYWPVLEMLVWGLTTKYLAASGAPGAATMTVAALLGGALLWEITLRAQMGMTFSFMEEIWSRNLGHISVSPLRPWEFVAGLMGMSVLRLCVGITPAMLLAWLLYGFGIFSMGPVVVLFFVALAITGWAVALGVTALILRHGAGAEALAWSVVYGLTPFACVFYPLASLPWWVQPVAQALPLAHIFEGMRQALAGGGIAWGHLGLAFALAFFWLGAMALVFRAQFQGARVRGALLNIGE
jgi:ABC-2 type transport system permease protein